MKKTSTNNTTMSVRFDPETLRRLERHCAHMQKVHGVFLKPASAVRALTKLALDDYEKGARR